MEFRKIQAKIITVSDNTGEDKLNEFLSKLLPHDFISISQSEVFENYDYGDNYWITYTVLYYSDAR